MNEFLYALGALHPVTQVAAMAVIGVTVWSFFTFMRGR